ncbi:YybH family protein [Paraburkholderia sabiae]|uniref:Nuclear transport factor 2 family protein n=1 Tax=Paraburkholderia sabiae TaxID=273251 RepID=A0ABU9QLA4_9BURK|nr:nuclear transport factor 2 family protein [Paraburkholderia sabiae]WJZ77360.1 nuclear transport factor 2 family protein [Paraburkholderia sabiae]CAD6547641.1 hypothetical protein LMG24235_04456 [Paraburkholderia sabiae]
MVSVQELEVHEAAQKLVAAFGSHDTERYFQAFAPDATFVFHNVPGRLESRAAYRALWKDWEAEGFTVVACESSDQHVQCVGDVAIFVHCVSTRIRFGTQETHSRERETIVFKRDGSNRWLAVHEHLSAAVQPDS